MWFVRERRVLVSFTDESPCHGQFDWGNWVKFHCTDQLLLYSNKNLMMESNHNYVHHLHYPSDVILLPLNYPVWNRCSKKKKRKQGTVFMVCVRTYSHVHEKCTSTRNFVMLLLLVWKASSAPEYRLTSFRSCASFYPEGTSHKFSHITSPSHQLIQLSTVKKGEKACFLHLQRGMGPTSEPDFFHAFSEQLSEIITMVGSYLR